MVVAAVGIDHDELSKLSAEFFADLPADAGIPDVKTQYSGGEVRLQALEENGLTHYAIAFESVDWHSDDLVPMCVLHMMMGGGGSFSVGGPGKGMHSRLFERVLNRHGFVESATSFNTIFNDSSLFGFYGTCAPQESSQLAALLTEQALEMAGPVAPVELSRAKNQLKSAVYMQLESDALQLEDIGRQVLTYDTVKSPHEISALIDEVTEADIKRVATNMLSTNPSICAYGNVSYVPRFETIAASF
jgi:processing peptidase subunit alpha